MRHVCSSRPTWQSHASWPFLWLGKRAEGAARPSHFCAVFVLFGELHISRRSLPGFLLVAMAGGFFWVIVLEYYRRYRV